MSICNPTPPTLLWDYVQIIGTGQSLGCGVQGTPVISSSQQFANIKIFDSSGSYTNPSALTLSAVPLTTPLRPAAGTDYPGNIAGEDCGTAAANMLSLLTQSVQTNGLKILNTCVARSGYNISQIAQGTTEYNGSIFEANACVNANRLIVPNGKTFGTLAIVLTHGEADATNAGYESAVRTLQQNYNTDLKAITGQSRNIPLIATQQCTEPTTTALPLSALAILQAHVDFPGDIICVGPKYQYPYASDHTHLTPAGYRALGCKYAEVLWNLVCGVTWNPLRPTGYSVSGQQVTITFNVPVGPLVFDATISPPHQSANTQWALGQGFEAFDSGGNLTIDSATINGNTVILQLHTTPSTGLKVSAAITPDVTGTEQGGLATGRRCTLRDSNPLCGYDGSNLYNFCVQFQSPALT